MLLFLFPYTEVQPPARPVPPFPHLTSCSPTEPNLCIASSVATAFSDPDTLTNLTFQVTNLKSTFHRFIRIQKIFPRQAPRVTLQLQAGGPPLNFCPLPLTQYTRKYRPFLRAFSFRHQPLQPSWQEITLHRELEEKSLWAPESVWFFLWNFSSNNASLCSAFSNLQLKASRSVCKSSCSVRGLRPSVTRTETAGQWFLNGQN
jgi:hypothetical protein